MSDLICNATPLIAFARINQLPLFEQVVGSVLIPAAVAAELSVYGGQEPGAVVLAEHPWIQVRSLTSRQQVEIRGHRDIENGLHWVRDVVLQEDAAPFRCKTPALNWSVLRSFTVNLYRANGHQSITTAIRRFRDDLHKLFSLLLMN